MNPFCACGCGKHAPPAFAFCDSGGAWWRSPCAAKTLKLVRCLQNLPHADLVTVLSVLQRNGFGTGVIVGAIPFDGENDD